MLVLGLSACDRFHHTLNFCGKSCASSKASVHAVSDRLGHRDGRPRVAQPRTFPPRSRLRLRSSDPKRSGLRRLQNIMRAPIREISITELRIVPVVVVLACNDGVKREHSNVSGHARFVKVLQRKIHCSSFRHAFFWQWSFYSWT